MKRSLFLAIFAAIVLNSCKYQDDSRPAFGEGESVSPVTTADSDEATKEGGIVLPDEMQKISKEDVKTESDLTQKFDKFFETFLIERKDGLDSMVDFLKLDQEGGELVAEIKEHLSLQEFIVDEQNSKCAYLLNFYNFFAINRALELLKNKEEVTQEKIEEGKITISNKEKTIGDLKSEIESETVHPALDRAMVCFDKKCPALLKEAFAGFKMKSQIDHIISKTHKREEKQEEERLRKIRVGEGQ